MGERVRWLPSSKLPKEKMLVGGEKFRMSGAGIGGGGGDGDWGVDIKGDGGEADFLAAGLVTELQRNFLGAERGVGFRDEWHAEDDCVLVDVQRNLGEGEGVKLALGIGDFAGGLEAGGKIDPKIGGD